MLAETENSGVPGGSGGAAVASWLTGGGFVTARAGNFEVVNDGSGARVTTSKNVWAHFEHFGVNRPAFGAFAFMPCRQYGQMMDMIPPEVGDRPDAASARTGRWIGKNPSGGKHRFGESPFHRI